MSAATPGDSESGLGLHALAPLTWRVLICLLLLFAAYAIAGRFAMHQVSALRTPILSAVNQRLPFEASVEHLEGTWFSYSPEIRFRELSLTQADASPRPLIARGALRVDVLASLASGSLQFSHLEIAGLALDARLTQDGVIELVGFDAAGNDLQAWLQDFLPNVERVALTDNRLRLATAGGSFDLTLNLLLERSGNERVLQGHVEGEALSLELNASGVGNPLRPLSWTGDIYVAAESADLGKFGGVWDTLDWPFRLSGAAAAQFWLSRAGGDSKASMRWNSTFLQIDERSGAWSLPLDGLSFEAALTQQARHWTLLTEDFHIERAGQALDLNRAQFDWWGQALRVRATDLGLDALPTLLAAAPGLPAGLREALPELAPRGQVRAIELRLDDLAKPAESWHLRSAVEGLEVGSWRNTPALSGVTGYLELNPGDGRLQLDSQELKARFPTLYAQTLGYDDALGELRFAWDDRGLRIDSGLVQLEGEEGRATGLIAVDIPFDKRDTGIELELLIGVEDSDLAYRERYLPQRIPAGLRSWLDSSPMEGRMPRAGFVWRGSVMPGNQVHRTVQLFFDVEDGRLKFSPDWPGLESVSGRLYLDDQLTWVNIPRSVSDGAALDRTRLRVIPRPGGARLDIATGVHGPAAAAGRMLSETPLRDLTGGVFADWQFAGDIDGEVFMSIPLGEDRAAPQVELGLELREVDVQVAQLDLPVDRVSGQLRFSSASGFKGTSAEATMLGGTVVARADDRTPRGLKLALAAKLPAESISDWLQLPVLRAARGVAQLEGELVVDEQSGVQLTLSSDLDGITLEAPRPFAKVPGRALPLSLTMPLRADPTIDVRLGERLKMRLALRDGKLEQLLGAVGPETQNLAACQERYCLGGTLSSLDIAAWKDFYDRYLTTGDGQKPAEDDVPEPAFSYRIDSLQVGELRLGARSLGQARVDLWGENSMWQGSLESPWLQGSLTREDEDLRLLVEYVDSARFASDEPASLADLRPLLADMRVDVLELRRDGQSIGSLGFDLDTGQENGALYATDIAGEIWGLRLDGPTRGMLRWADEAGVESTTLELDAQFDDAGAVLMAAGFAPTLESESGAAALRLRWPGGPTSFSALTADGEVRLLANNGRVLEARPGALAMISFLNLAEILRGLSLAHMFDAGLPFLKATTELQLHGGTLEVEDLHIDGAASAFAFTGVSDLEAGNISGELLVTLPVANNLPWVAALAAGLPIAAGVFVVSKVFEKQVNRMSSAVYGVSGDIDAPQVEFRRLFDDKLIPTPVTPADSETGGG